MFVAALNGLDGVERTTKPARNDVNTVSRDNGSSSGVCNWLIIASAERLGPIIKAGATATIQWCRVIVADVLDVFMACFQQHDRDDGLGTYISAL